MMRTWALYQPGMEFISSCGILIVAGVGTTQVLDGKMEIGALVAFFVLTRFLYEPIGKLHQLNQIFQSGRAAGDRVFEIMDAVAEADDGKKATCPPIQ